MSVGEGSVILCGGGGGRQVEIIESAYLESRSRCQGRL